MSRCPHCKKLTHSEHLYVRCYSEDLDKLHELQDEKNWTRKFMYSENELILSTPHEYGKLKVGDLYSFYSH